MILRDTNKYFVKEGREETHKVSVGWIFNDDLFSKLQHIPMEPCNKLKPVDFVN